MRRALGIALVFTCSVVVLLHALPAQVPLALSKVHALDTNEGVFAYARISPDGRTLAYASERPSAGRGVETTQTVVDLASRKTLFSEPGIDAYWSLDGKRMIFLSQAASSNVTIRHADSGRLVRDAAPVGLGDYFSWAKRDGRDLILTIQSNYYYLDGDKAVLPAGRVVSCPGIGVGDRPLISKDGRRISTFVRGAVVVRNLSDCNNVVDTGLQGAKADFSWDGRYVAFHVPRGNSKVYEIVVVDTERRTMRRISGLPGSSLFPSWTEDGRLCFRYDGDDYRGFMMASHVLSLPERPLPNAGSARVPDRPRWESIFPETPVPSAHTALVMVWATWSAHAPDALSEFQDARRAFAARGDDVATLTATEISSLRVDADRLRRERRITLPEIPLAPGRLLLTEAVNQIPTTLLFEDGQLVDRRLGAQTAEQLRAWIGKRKQASGDR